MAYNDMTANAEEVVKQKYSKTAKLEIGRIYRTGGGTRRYRLAVDEHRLISAYDNTVVEHKQASALTVMGDMTAEQLCAEWGIQLEELDVMSRTYIYPGLKPNPKHLDRGEGRRSRTPTPGHAYRLAQPH